MAISPKYLESNFKDENKSFESYFDTELQSCTITKGKSLFFSIPNGYTFEHHILLANKYVEAGWESVTWESDQRDGDSIKFKY